MKVRNSIAIALIGILFFAFNAEAKKVKIKFALLAPEGTSWVDITNKGFKEIEKRSKGEIDFKMYAGAKQGDEPVVVQKLRIGSVQASGFTSVALSEIVNEFQVLGLPGLIENYEELDNVQAKLLPMYEEKFEKQGFIFLGFAEIGPIYVFTKIPVRTIDDFRQVKMWAMPGEPIAPVALDKIGMKPITVPLTDVMIQLEAGGLDGFVNTPVGSIAFQWYRKTNYMTSEPLLYSSGGVLIKKDVWDQISPENQVMVKEVMHRVAAEQRDQMRIENKEAITTLTKSGITQIEITKESRERIVKEGEWVRKMFVGKYYSQELLDNVIGWVNEVRNKKK